MQKKKKFFFLLYFFTSLFPLSVFAKIPDDPYVSEQWYLEAISAPEAWDRTTGSKDVVVAVLDAGVDLDHPDLLGQLWVNAGEVLGDGFDNDQNGFPDDRYGWDFVGRDPDPNPETGPAALYDAAIHGTLLAGMIAAATGNAEGIAGVSWKTTIMPVRILDGQGVGDTRAAARGISYAVANGADIINMSFTGVVYDAMLEEIVKNAYRKGVLIVAAVGNENLDLNVTPMYPACFSDNGEDWVLGVAAVNSEMEKADFSNYGSACTEINAPGTGIFGALTHESNRPNYTAVYGGYFDGTSVSVPQVSAAASLLKAIYPTLTVQELQLSLRLGAAPDKTIGTVWSGEMGSGTLDIAGALRMAAAYAGDEGGVFSENLCLDGVCAGDYMRGSSFETVYYVDENFERRPFLNATTYFTYEENFNQVKIVADTLLAEFFLGAPMLPKPGVVFVKIQSLNDVYALFENTEDSERIELRLIPDESTARKLYGTDWADYVIDLPSTIWPWFTFGEDLDESSPVDVDQMKKREDLV